MRILLLTAVVLSLAGAGYLLNRSPSGAWDRDGNPHTLLFTVDRCGAPCSSARRMLRDRQVVYEELDVTSNPAHRERLASHGGRSTFPYVVMGNRHMSDYSPTRLLSAIAQQYGGVGVRPEEQAAIARNFDASGNPRLVMYATETCGYCRDARRYFARHGIDYEERQIDREPAARHDYAVLLGQGTPLLFNGFRTASGFRGDPTARQLGL